MDSVFETVIALRVKGHLNLVTSRVHHSCRQIASISNQFCADRRNQNQLLADISVVEPIIEAGKSDYGYYLCSAYRQA